MFTYILHAYIQYIRIKTRTIHSHWLSNTHRFLAHTYTKRLYTHDHSKVLHTILVYGLCWHTFMEIAQWHIILCRQHLKIQMILWESCAQLCQTVLFQQMPWKSGENNSADKILIRSRDGWLSLLNGLFKRTWMAWLSVLRWLVQAYLDGLFKRT